MIRKVNERNDVKFMNKVKWQKSKAKGSDDVNQQKVKQIEVVIVI